MSPHGYATNVRRDGLRWAWRAVHLTGTGKRVVLEGRAPWKWLASWNAEAAVRRDVLEQQRRRAALAHRLAHGV